MWRRLTPHLRTLAAAASRGGAPASRGGAPAAPLPPLRPISRFLSAGAGSDVVKKKVEEVMPIATGHEREEIEAELEGKKRFDMDAPCGPFGTKEAPAIIHSVYDKRIVGCPGGEGEDEHDVVWFWLEKGKPHVCPVCEQYFMLEVIGPGGPPGGHHHDDDEEEDH